MLSDFKKNTLLNAKNLIGWRINRNIVVISIDDYGNVRLDSQQARNRMDKDGLKIYSRFDVYDSLETRGDLMALYEVLTSVQDRNGRYPVLTPYATPCNINFEKVAETGFNKYYYELLPETFGKLSLQQPLAYEGTWELWQEGIRNGLLVPLFHGREHLNLKIFEEKLKAKDFEVITALNNRSYTSISSNGYKTVSAMAAFDFWDFIETDKFDAIIEDGLNAFEKVFGYRANHFNPPGGREHPVIHKVLKENGVKYIDTPLIKREHLGQGKYRTVFNYTGKKNIYGQTFLVRNVVFEPTDERGIAWVSYAMKQIEAAFRWNRPAIISSHRVNFCGHIDEENRRKGLKALQRLLKNITERWPDVEFMAANELGSLIDSKK